MLDKKNVNNFGGGGGGCHSCLSSKLESPVNDFL